MSFDASVHAKAVDLIKLALDMTAAAGSGHPTSAASLAHLTTVLLYNHMRYDPNRPGDRNADRLVLSEGHACPIVYAAAADLGFAIGRGERRPMTRDDALRLREIDSEIDGHPNPAEGFPFFPAATGSLGQGLSIAAGLALAGKMDERDDRTYCLIGDGESREGQIWEAVDFLVDYDLRQVCPIFNCNAYGQTGEVSSRQSPATIEAKLRAAGFEVRRIDGHQPGEIQEALRDHVRAAGAPSGKPFAIVAKTVKGWGFSPNNGRNLHGKPVTGSDKERAFVELDETAARLGAKWTTGVLEIPEFTPAPAEPPPRRESPGRFRRALAAAKPDWQDEDKLATRKAYGVALHALGHADPRVVVLDGDVGNSTYTQLFSQDDSLAPRFFEARIAEQNMVSCAAGLSVGERLPFVSSFGKFVMRAYDQLEMAIVSRANLKVMGSHVGVSLAADGPSQMALPDVAFFRAFTTVRSRSGVPMCYVLQPADAFAAYALTVAMAEHEGPCYIRTQRPDVPFLYDDDTEFELGGHHVLREGADLLVVASGYMVHEAKKAIDRFEDEGIRPTLVDLYSLPFDEAAIVQLTRSNHGRVLSVEDNYGAGIGSAVADALTNAGAPARLRQMHVRRVPKSGRTPDDVLTHLNLHADDIFEAGKALLKHGER